MDRGASNGRHPPSMGLMGPLDPGWMCGPEAGRKRGGPGFREGRGGGVLVLPRGIGRVFPVLCCIPRFGHLEPKALKLLNEALPCRSMKDEIGNGKIDLRTNLRLNRDPLVARKDAPDCLEGGEVLALE